MAERRTNAELLAIVNVVLLAIAIPLLILCLLRGLWVQGAVFSLLIFSNGYQLWTSKRRTDGPDSR